jgi:hypothetical protein
MAGVAVEAAERRRRLIGKREKQNWGTRLDFGWLPPILFCPLKERFRFFTVEELFATPVENLGCTTKEHGQKINDPRKS